MSELDLTPDEKLRAALHPYNSKAEFYAHLNANPSDFGADAQTAAERRILSAIWEHDHPGVDSSRSRL